MTTPAIQAAIQQALALPCWKSPENPRQLGGGITNINLLITDQGKDYVVRLGHDIPEHGVMRFNELAISRAAEAAGISPAVHYAEPGAMVLDFVDAAPLSEADVRNPETLMQAVELVGRVHREIAPKLRGPVLTFWVFHVLRDYAATLRDLGSSHLSVLPDLMDQAQIMERAVGPIDLVLGHNDLLPANILRSKDRLWLIDWEYGGFNSPLFDLGGLATNSGLDPEAEVQMLKAYYGSAPDAELLHRYTAMKCASLLRETMWSMVSELTSEIDFDYAAYTAENLSRYQRAYTEFISLRIET
ncbi:phosphotransferase [Pseudohalocynthiibacter aestuariivivens]|jgi:thiamine kinase-like enzyme|uniref:Phosphotransferase n=1 Tax=Pseudohalocynthiibacter aestuariivivens TaxID=1591409 RepID=A0ABV5JB11_9RHOB|nr:MULTISPECIES: phosphotransferase [Pseudohalocynthiibacter]MBS9715815.1 phosphotransferase [Pseudohalocynthiibacter aestuariivivens]MCK0101428.1 phosphotransferase [Pseudohalocynthiibacter sp. F2068]